MGSRFHLIKSEKFYTVDVFLIHTYTRKVWINREYSIFYVIFLSMKWNFVIFIFGLFWNVKITKILKNRMARILNEISMK